MIDEFRGYYAFLSNFYLREVEYEGVVYKSVEHAYQAAKTLNIFERIDIGCAVTPSAAKFLGRRATLRPDWEQVKIEVMRTILRKKFAPGSVLDGMLLMTGDEELVEDNYWGDTFWGVCGGIGENHLGKLLMEIRQELRDAQTAQARQD